VSGSVCEHKGALAPEAHAPDGAKAVRIESVFMGTDRQLLPILFGFYAPNAKEVRDVTANRRKMWDGVSISANTKWYDIDPQVSPDVVCDWSSLPDSANSVDVLVYDPPHLPKAAASPASSPQMVTDYGLSNSCHGDNIASLHGPFLREAKRVLRKNGVAFCKLKDFVHNHRYQWTLADFVSQVIDAGMTPCDLIVKCDPCGGNLKSGRWKKAHHARNCHCWWVVVRNGRCEP
jgi:hypothetical protein